MATRRSIGDPLVSQDGVVRSVVFSPDGKTLAISTNPGTTQLWNVTHDQLTLDIDTQLGGDSVAFSPDGKTLAVSIGGGTIRLWDIAEHRETGNSLIGHTAVVYSMAFSPDGKTLATGSADRTTRLWDITTHQPIGGPLTRHADQVRSVAFSPDGRNLATGGDDHTVRLWDIGFTIDPVSALCEWANGTFAQDRWMQYVPKGPKYRRLCP